MKTSLSKKIAQRLKEVGGWVHKGQIESRAKEWGYLGETGGRRCREMVEDGILEVKQENGSDWYRYIPQEKVYNKVEIIGNKAIIRQEKLFV